MAGGGGWRGLELKKKKERKEDEWQAGGRVVGNLPAAAREKVCDM